MEFEGIVERAREVRRLYERVERDAYGRPWSLEELTLGLVGDVGDLAKLVQAHEGVRRIDDVQARLEHELADVLWAIIAIAEQCDVDSSVRSSRPWTSWHASSPGRCSRWRSRLRPEAGFAGRKAR